MDFYGLISLTNMKFPWYTLKITYTRKLFFIENIGFHVLIHQLVAIRSLKLNVFIVEKIIKHIIVNCTYWSITTQSLCFVYCLASLIAKSFASVL